VRTDNRKRRKEEEQARKQVEKLRKDMNRENANRKNELLRIKAQKTLERLASSQYHSTR